MSENIPEGRVCYVCGLPLIESAGYQGRYYRYRNTVVMFG